MMSCWGVAVQRAFGPPLVLFVPAFQKITDNTIHLDGA